MLTLIFNDYSTGSNVCFYAALAPFITIYIEYQEKVIGKQKHGIA